MARVIAFVPDLLFGSNVVGALRAAGHEVRLVSTLEDVSLGDTRVLVCIIAALLFTLWFALWLRYY